jgi:methyl acetate hydrolase
LYSTAGDYVRFTRMILGQGRGANNVRILEPKTVESMEIDQIGAATAGKMKSYRPSLSRDVDIQPGATEKEAVGLLDHFEPAAYGSLRGAALTG